MSAKPLIIGHRGASALAPENTIAAFDLALKSGAEGIEFDVRLSREGIPVIIHDETLRRTGLRPDRVSDLTVAEIKQVNVGTWFSRKHGKSNDEFGDQTIPTLEELFARFPAPETVFYLEMKSEPAQRRELVSACCQLLKQHPMKGQVIVECFDLTAIKLIKTLDPLLRTAALFEPKVIRHLLPSAQRLVAQATAVGADEIAVHHRLATKRTIEKARAANLKVVVWTVDDTGWIVKGHKLGVQALITNDPARLLVKRQSFRAD
jgi:glycerophosphoryl diester phosphodiesterase